MTGHRLSSNVVLHCNKHPHLDYLPINARRWHENSESDWIAVHRDALYRQLVMIQEVKLTSLTSLSCLAKIALPTVARVVAMYHDGESLFSVTEYIELEVGELLPLEESEIADLFAQIIKGLHSLLAISMCFRISNVRITSSGAVKLFLDWGYEPSCDQAFVQAEVPYLALFLWHIFDSLGVKAWSFRALEVREMLKSGHLPHLSHPFFRLRVSLRAAAAFAVQNKLVIGGREPDSVKWAEPAGNDLIQPV